MKYTVTEEDKTLFSQGTLEYKYRLSVMNKSGAIIDVLYCILQVGTYGINGESNIRRTLDATIDFDEFAIDIEDKIEGWYGLDFKFEIGIYSIRNNDFIWYPAGTYVITAANTTYNSATNTLIISLSDHFAQLDGTRNGQVGGAPLIKIPVDNDSGKKTILREALSTVLRQQGGVENMIIEDIGEFYGMESNNADYEEYRKNNPEWNVLPYDLEFDAGCTVGDQVDEITGLYPNIQKYFDVYDIFCCNMIPSCENDPVALSDDFLQEIVLSDNAESVTYDIENIKNVTEVFGTTYEVDRMAEAEQCTSDGDTYSLTLDEYDKYTIGEYIAFIANVNNVDNMKLRINSLDPIPIYFENTERGVTANTMLATQTYVLQLKKVDDAWRFYWLGQYQPHAICVLTDTDNDPVYTKQYFCDRYNCKNVVLRIEPDSPFTIQKIGIVLDVKTGDRYDDIKSDTVAIENAIYENIKTSSWNDVVTLTTMCVPWLDVYEKVSWRKANSDDLNEYVIQSISHSLSSTVPTTTITMYRFHPLYYDYEIPY